MSELEKAFRKKVLKLIPKQAFIGEVRKVDENNYTCAVMPIDSEAEIFKVRLKPSIDTNKKGIIGIPAVGSFVIVGLLGNNENSAFVVWCSNIKKYYIVGDGGNTFEFKDDGTILINGEDYAGVIKIIEQTAKLNKLVGELQRELGLIATGIVAGGGTYTPGILSTFNKSDFENTKVKHGKGN